MPASRTCSRISSSFSHRSRCSNPDARARTSTSSRTPSKSATSCRGSAPRSPASREAIEHHGDQGHEDHVDHRRALRQRYAGQCTTVATSPTARGGTSARADCAPAHPGTGPLAVAGKPVAVRDAAGGFIDRAGSVVHHANATDRADGTAYGASAARIRIAFAGVAAGPGANPVRVPYAGAAGTHVANRAHGSASGLPERADDLRPAAWPGTGPAPATSPG